jgi:acetate kinase
MGFTPAAGLVMGTRSGDLDPGLVAFLARAQGLTPPAFDRMVNHQAGLLGLSGTTADVRTLNRRAKRDRRAALALEVFAYQAAKWIGALTAVLGGLDTLVFAGGIGENDAGMRERICARLGYLGVRLDPGRNRRNAAVISRSRLAVRVRVIPTDEEKMIARSTGRLLRRPAQP